MSTQGKIKVSKNVYIIWSKHSDSEELWAGLYAHDKTMVSGWWRTDSLESLELRIKKVYANEIAKAEVG